MGQNKHLRTHGIIAAGGFHTALGLARIFHTFGFGAPIFNRLSPASRPQSRLQVGAPACQHFVRRMKYPGLLPGPSRSHRIEQDNWWGERWIRGPAA